MQRRHCAGESKTKRAGKKERPDGCDGNAFAHRGALRMMLTRHPTEYRRSDTHRRGRFDAVLDRAHLRGAQFQLTILRLLAKDLLLALSTQREKPPQRLLHHIPDAILADTVDESVTRQLGDVIGNDSCRQRSNLRRDVSDSIKNNFLCRHECSKNLYPVYVFRLDEHYRLTVSEIR